MLPKGGTGSICTEWVYKNTLGIAVYVSTTSNFYERTDTEKIMRKVFNEERTGGSWNRTHDPFSSWNRYQDRWPYETVQDGDLKSCQINKSTEMVKLFTQEIFLESRMLLLKNLSGQI